MSHRSTPEKELEVQLELYLGIGTFSEIGSSNPKNQKKFFRSKITKNGQKWYQKGSKSVFLCFLELLNFWKFFDFFHQNDVFRLWAYDFRS